MDEEDQDVIARTIDFKYGSQEGVRKVATARVTFVFSRFGLTTPIKPGSGRRAFTTQSTTVDLEGVEDNAYDEAEGMARLKLAKEWREHAEGVYEVNQIERSDDEEVWHATLAFKLSNATQVFARIEVERVDKPVTRPSQAIKLATVELRAMLREFADRLQGTALLTYDGPQEEDAA